MAATKAEISEWFDVAVAKGARYLLVVCDTFGLEDYPVHAQTADECLALCAAPGDMQRVMEVYDLSADKDEQLAEHRTFRLPKPTTSPRTSITGSMSRLRNLSYSPPFLFCTTRPARTSSACRSSRTTSR